MAAKKKAAPKATPKDPTRYVVVALSTYTSEVSSARCAVRAGNGDDLPAMIKQASSYNGDDYVVVLRVEKIVKVPTTLPKNVPSLANVAVEELTT